MTHNVLSDVENENKKSDSVEEINVNNNKLDTEKTLYNKIDRRIEDITKNDKIDSVNRFSDTNTYLEGDQHRTNIDRPGSSVSRFNSVDKKAVEPGGALEAALAQLGHFGLYQRYTIFLLCIPNILSAMYSLNYVFVADRVPFRCVVPECEGSYNVQFNNTLAQTLLPADSCQRYAPHSPHQQSCDRQEFLNHTIACEEFVYETMETVFAEFDLACREWMRTLVGTVRNSALPLALVLTGYISDGWGRRTAFCIFTAFAGVMGIIKALSVNYQMYVSFEFFEALLGYGFNGAAYVMMVELARPSLRSAFACASGVAYGVGGVLFAFIASRVRYWRELLGVIHAPALLLPLYWLLLDESPRWLHATQKTERAIGVIRKAARWNKVNVDEELITALKDDQIAKSEANENAWKSLITSRVLLIRFALCSWCWVAAAFVYYGLTINSVALSGDKYVNFMLNMSMDIVASFLMVMALERFGRRRSIFTAFLICGVACVIPYFVSHEGTGLGLYFLGKLSITFAFNSLYVFTAELFPTSARSSALSAASLIGRIGSVAAPQTPLLSIYVQTLLYGGCALLAAGAALGVPETRRAPLPQHVRQAEGIRPEVAHTLDTASRC